MGCHTWFQRPITKEEREKLRQTAKESIFEEPVFLDEFEIKRFLESVDNDTDLWLKSGLYTYADFICEVDDKFYVDLANREIKLQHGKVFCCDIQEPFHDNFIVRNYPTWVIHNRHELRKKMGKKYFDLTEKQLEDISRFFKMYPGGVITFG